MIKKELRSQVISSMKEMDKKEKSQKDLQLLDLVCQSESYQNARIIATYLAMPHEFKTSLLIKRALGDGKKIAIPKTYGKGKMIFVLYHPKELQRTSFGLMEPISDVELPKDQIDLIHVPGVGFNAEGYRIGYGGGYYDRYLSDYQGRTCSTIYQCQVAEFIPESHDLAVEMVYTL
ncbi:5-formyltetrahydrofolate cyclo-ligase [Streptococcus hongkongensis]|nr:5-formyltetrahydrofolate cyclo-ligase [Streptococcus uberis]